MEGDLGERGLLPVAARPGLGGARGCTSPDDRAFVSFFIGDSIIISGFKKEKKLADKTESEIRSEKEIIQNIEAKLEHIEQEVDSLIESAEQKL